MIYLNNLEKSKMKNTKIILNNKMVTRQMIKLWDTMTLQHKNKKLLRQKKGKLNN